MNFKKVTGYIFIVLAILLSIAALGMLPNILRSVFAFFKIFTGSLKSYEVGYAAGSMISWVIYFAAIAALWKFGRRWTKRITNYSQPDVIDSDLRHGN